MAHEQAQAELRAHVEKYLLQLRPYLHSESSDAEVAWLEDDQLGLVMHLPHRGCASRAHLLAKALQCRILEQFPNIGRVVIAEVRQVRPE